MSGLFARLAGQARGQREGVMPRARSRFDRPAPAASDDVLPQGTQNTEKRLGAPDRVAIRADEEGATPATPRSSRPTSNEERRLSVDAVTSTTKGSFPERAESIARPAQGEPAWLLPPVPPQRRYRDDAGERGPAPPSPRAVAKTFGAVTAKISPKSALGPEQNEVHVHIGRVEVTAAYEAPRRRDAARRAEPSRRLEEYLRPRGAR